MPPLTPAHREGGESSRAFLLLTTTQWPETFQIDLGTGARLPSDRRLELFSGEPTEEETQQE